MCGYCYEGIMLHIVETGERYDGHQFCYLEETDDLKTEINQLQNPNEPEHLIDLAFCRLYDHYFTQGFDIELADTLQNKFGEKAVAAYLARRQVCPSEVFRDELSRINILNDETCWNQFMANKETIYASALELLNFYYDWWLLGINKELITQAPSNEEIRQATDDQWNKFKAFYPAIFFAFTFILHHHPDAEIIKRIALTHANEEPDYWTKESWLQRKAMLASIQQNGIGFIVDNFKQVRYELIYYVLLKATINPAELSLLKEAMVSEEKDPPLYGAVEREHVVDLIDF
jgi:hypothetical protein